MSVLVASSAASTASERRLRQGLVARLPGRRPASSSPATPRSRGLAVGRRPTDAPARTARARLRCVVAGRVRKGRRRPTRGLRRCRPAAWAISATIARGDAPRAPGAAAGLAAKARSSASAVAAVRVRPGRPPRLSSSAPSPRRSAGSPTDRRARPPSRRRALAGCRHDQAHATACGEAIRVLGLAGGEMDEREPVVDSTVVGVAESSRTACAE